MAKRVDIADAERASSSALRPDSQSCSRRRMLRAIAVATVARPLCAFGSSHATVRRIAWLSLGKPWDLAVFRLKLADLGWIEGHNLAIEKRFADNDQDRLTEHANELARLDVEVIVTQSSAAALAAAAATGRIPIVMAGGTSALIHPIVREFAHPVANVTGVTNDLPGLGLKSKPIQLLRMVAPGLTRLALLTRRADLVSPSAAFAPSVGDVAVLPAFAETHDDVPRALGMALAEGANGLLAGSTPVNVAMKTYIVDFALTHGWPSMYGDRNFVRAGGLMSYWADWEEIRRQAAIYVDRILRGAKPADLPIALPSKFELVVNLRTAAALHLNVPAALRLRADELIS